MKSNVKLAEFIPHLPAQLQEGLDALMKSGECEAELHRTISLEALAAKGDHCFIGYASTRTLDRDLEIVMPGGMDLSQFRKSPVLLWGHKWSEPPIGKDETIENDNYGLKTKSQMASTPLAEDLWTLVKAEMLKTSSIGFIPLEMKHPGDKEWGALMDKLNAWPEFDKNAEMHGVITRSILLEHSLVSVPANVDALVTSISAKGLSCPTILKELGKAIGSFHGKINDIVLPPPPEVPPATVKLYHKLVKTPEQIRLELELEVQTMVAREMKILMGRI